MILPLMLKTWKCLDISSALIYYYYGRKIGTSISCYYYERISTLQRARAEVKSFEKAVELTRKFQLHFVEQNYNMILKRSSTCFDYLNTSCINKNRETIKIKSSQLFVFLCIKCVFHNLYYLKNCVIYSSQFHLKPFLYKVIKMIYKCI